MEEARCANTELQVIERAFHGYYVPTSRRQVSAQITETKAASEATEARIAAIETAAEASQH